MTNVIDMNEYRPRTTPPKAIVDLKAWLVWRLVYTMGQQKPRKIPYYTNGNARSGQGSDDEPFATFALACSAVAKNGYTGVGLAMRASNGLVAVDFDDCVRDGVIDERVLALCEGTYSEISPSGNGVRAFFRGALRDKKDLDGDLKVEFFHANGYVTVTGNRTADCEVWDWDVAPLSDAVRALHGGDATVDDDFLAGLSPRIGLSLDKAKALLAALDPDLGYHDWLHAGQALHHEFEGSSEALALWMEWSKQSEEKYPGDRVLKSKWDGFGRYQGAPITAAWLLKHGSVAKAAERYEALDHWKERLAEADEQTIRENLCPQIGKDDRLGGVDREALAQAVMARLKRLGTTLPIATVRLLVATPEALTPTVKAQRPLTEFGNAMRMLDKFGDKLMFVPELEAWYAWTDVYWKRITDIEVEQYAKETVLGLVKEADGHNDQGEFLGFAALSQQARMVRNMVSLAASDPRVMVSSADLDAHPYLLGVQNGVVDLKTGRLFEPDPAYRITRVCSCEYKPGARADLWQSTLRDVFFSDQEVVDFLQRLAGYCAIGQPNEDIMVIAHGDGSNGKSTVIGTIRRVLGGYARTADPASFIADGKSNSGGGAREDLVRLRGSRLVYVAEPDEGGELKEGLIKSMTGGDAISARGLYAKHSIEFEPSWVVVMPTNHKPIIKGSDNGIWRRLMLLPFLRNFEKDQSVPKDPQREEKLRAESEGVLAWIVLGAGAYLQRGLCPPDVVTAARDQYRSQMDILSEWMDDCCELGDAYRESSQNLWKSWEEYAKSRGILRYIPSNVALGRRLDKRFPTAKAHGGVRMRLGIQIRASTFDADDFFDETREADGGA